MFVRTLLTVVVAAMVSSCSSPVSAQDAAIACGWNEPIEPIVPALQADAEQLERNAQRARTRFEAAQRVVRADERFEPLAEALGETAEFAAELQDMSEAQMQQVPAERWDFAKYALAAARDQCRQLAAVVESG